MCNVLLFYSFSFDPSLKWPLLLKTASVKGHAQLSHIMSVFLHHFNDYLMAFTCMLQQGINGVGLEAFRNGVYWQSKRGV